MGLDITYYSKVTLVEPMTFKELEAIKFEHPFYDSSEHVYLWNHPEFVERGDGLVEGFYAVLSWKREYRVSVQHQVEGGRFRAGSYSGYNAWREWLAALVGTTPQKVWDGEVPTHFGELISFPDNEGFIGPTTSAKLAKDFEACKGKMKASVRRDWHVDLFKDFAQAFQTAAGEGIVDFH